MTTRLTHNATIEPDGKQALLFDMDGVILEGYGTDPDVHACAFRDAVDDLDFDPEVPLESLPALETDEYTETFARTCQELGLDPAEFYALREEYSAKRSIDRIKRGARGLYDDVDVLDELDRSHPVGLVSNNYDPTVSFVVDHFDLEAFSFVRGRDLGVEGFRRRKPEPYYIETALDALGLDDGMYVGDRETDLLAAQNAGLVPVLIRRPHNETLEPSIDNHLEIESLEELLEHL
ncbi:HAD family hydrolase [Natronobacterium gregoryi]|uniref:HAD family hydrolase n=2 Tax=Natronobacterium gregoryi TaxID=44930 RepID=L0AJE5_NATGS|nr:HAD-IA family hydrolase [Natronobacterium gregoryi]AFZ73931.1 haloacid dehalogenase superfamily enzyme, subfamily IA [Natronobacterium gregoryi SP2]ELY71733.1 HAD-superfamily hydrolase [Natronobacterium gregoryi SP2]PLK19511.1 HAD family hydrolase [Natronobacterium gregoryi SP2]SFJ46849.1 haloacid dehalogenase superfamily, subfamily IA, variant 1 with third motif having Dx(3-4)D or Dx(3-4)E [Natronobacterium gregoryi]